MLLRCFLGNEFLTSRRPLYPEFCGKFYGSDPIHGDVFKNNYQAYYSREARRKIEEAFFRKKEREGTHIASCSCFWVLQTGLGLRNNARLHHDFLHLNPSNTFECSGYD